MKIGAAEILERYMQWGCNIRQTLPYKLYAFHCLLFLLFPYQRHWIQRKETNLIGDMEKQRRIESLVSRAGQMWHKTQHHWNLWYG